MSRRTATRSTERGLNIISGSEITTLGLKKVFEKRSNVNKVTRYGPGNYKSLDDDNLKLLIIEGWDSTLPEFIRRVRKYHPLVKIFFWNLSFLGSRDIIRLNVDGYLTNSRKVIAILEKVAPTKFVMLAADPGKPIVIFSGQ